MWVLVRATRKWRPCMIFTRLVIYIKTTSRIGFDIVLIYFIGFVCV